MHDWDPSNKENSYNKTKTLKFPFLVGENRKNRRNIEYSQNLQKNPIPNKINEINPKKSPNTEYSQKLQRNSNPNKTIEINPKKKSLN